MNINLGDGGELINNLMLESVGWLVDVSWNLVKLLGIIWKTSGRIYIIWQEGGHLSNYHNGANCLEPRNRDKKKKKNRWFVLDIFVVRENKKQKQKQNIVRFVQILNIWVSITENNFIDIFFFKSNPLFYGEQNKY